MNKKICVAALAAVLAFSAAGCGKKNAMKDAADSTNQAGMFDKDLNMDSDKEIIYQVSLLQGLMLGDYNGSISAADLTQRGDTGIGTFDGLNGELIMNKGIVYRAAADGTVEKVPDNETIPFSNVTFFEVDISGSYENIESFEALRSELDKKVESLGKNRFYMIKIEGTFKKMNVRSEYKQEEPYKPLAEVLETDQTFFNYEDVAGTVVGLYCPEYMKDLNAPGWHLHFISDDETKGGHVLDLAFDTANIGWDCTNGFRLILPGGEMFSGFDLTVDQTEDIKKVETNE